MDGIRVENLRFAYQPGTPNEVVALRGVNLQIEKGRYLVIIGHNGSGKSTLAKHLNGLLLPTRGDVWVEGLNTKEPHNIRSIRSRVGLVLQVPDNQIVATVVEQDVAFGPENLGLPEAELRERVEWALKTVGLWEERQRAPHLLSAGQKQRLAVAGVLAMNPHYLVLDEATALLDPRGREGLLATISELHTLGIAIVAITHFMEEAVHADEVIVLNEGKIVERGSPREVFAQVEEMRELQLDVPQPTALSYRLHQRCPTFPSHLLSVEEVVSTVLRRHQERLCHG